MTKAFETEFTIAIGTLSGGITDITVKEKEGGKFQDALIIRTDHEWQVNVNWVLKGTMLDKRWLDIQGKWLLKAYLEGWGKDAQELDRDGDAKNGIRVDPAPKIVKAGALALNDPPETEWQYSETFTFAAGAIQPGTYKLAIAITYVDDAGLPGPMAGFIEFGDMLQIYNPGP